MKLNPKDIQQWAIIGVVAYLAFKFFKPLDALLSIPGAIVDGVKKTGDNIQKILEPGKPYEQPKPTTTPALPTAELARIAGKLVYSASNSADLRTLPKSNASLIKTIAKGAPVGYVFSAVNEKLGATDKAWLAITASPNIDAKIIGYIPHNRISLSNGIGCILN